ncbi:hypothetical protein [Acuticoccus sp. I52.16.1]|uniref:hypothetical protein n=1 Tax=Acuticoccus sp. I52.16.1 TaxID=2928472 RepID=UPI001FD08DA5|nr:hypothetical protein [Acuticoccus sp. I52.16.1]UOM37256.1 hypothetical protein MRB58_24075 [Acuticoccus sp. I52.16.1]
MFETEIARQEDGTLAGPWRRPRQMLSDQDYGGHASMHDDATARSVGFRGGAIEGPTHFSQFVPLCVAHFGADWLAHGCLSAHYRAPAYEGDEVRAVLTPGPRGDAAQIRIERADGTEILRGTASIGADAPPSALDERLSRLEPLAEPVILSRVSVGARVPAVPVRMGMHDPMGALYPFTLADKLRVITEPSPAYRGPDNPWGRPLVPFEMVSVLMQHTWDDTALGVKGPALGMFADQEIRLVAGPVLQDVDYTLEREVVFLSGSRRTESAWIRSTLRDAASGATVAIMLLNSAVLKETYAPYFAEREALYGR